MYFFSCGVCFFLYETMQMLLIFGQFVLSLISTLPRHAAQGSLFVCENSLKLICCWGEENFFFDKLD